MRQEHPYCCGIEMRAIEIGVPAPTGLWLYLCDLCRQSDWRRNGVQITAEQALDTANALNEAVDGFGSSHVRFASMPRGASAS